MGAAEPTRFRKRQTTTVSPSLSSQNTSLCRRPVFASAGLLLIICRPFQSIQLKLACPSPQHPSLLYTDRSRPAAAMADNKKRDDLVIDLDEKTGRYDSPMRSPMSPTPRTPGMQQPAPPPASNPIIPVLAYCGSSILMTVTNKFVLSGSGFNLNFFLLCVQVSDSNPRGWEWC
jgi:hypothetical protein